MGTGKIRGLWSQLGLIPKIETALKLVTALTADNFAATCSTTFSNLVVGHLVSAFWTF